MSRRTTAMTISAAGATFTRRELTIDDPAAGEVLVRIEAVGMCHADLAVRAGEFPFPLPGVAGHEGAGRVEAVGAGVTSVRPGDRVMLTFDSCGHCVWCVSGEPSRCLGFVAHNFTNGARPDGSPTLWDGGTPVHGSFFGQSSFASYALARERNTVRVPDVASDVPSEVLAPLGCGVQTGAGAVLNVLAPEAGSAVAVFGAGVVGLSAVMAAAMLPVGRIVVVDVQDTRLDLARALGATDVVNSRTEDARERVTRLTGGGPQYVVESSGVPAVLAEAIRSLGIGGTGAVVGVPPFGITAAIDVADLVNGSKRVVGVVEGRSNPPVFLPRLAELVATGRLPVGRLVGTFPLEEVETAAEAMKAGTTIKPVLVPG
ncbi:NAD(P)-dependent alcohol dehydrogenase [Pseudonocardia cypriaca]|uniref:Aryl-alcohol dehydrogenase n=1 Tax=Pseudonocardia cypriaca TaxID=882449 RepID=A0A543FTE3_9PSEU|nr:NAD(P)-dependent alcohol dehydrogenase [Pseudonocardia cypriaca]TQM37101.1 aryl-alcohol dehydrogenase [Pseudonocardia cypriaca]